jgi:hypothetical protein
VSFLKISNGYFQKPQNTFKSALSSLKQTGKMAIAHPNFVPRPSFATGSHGGQQKSPPTAA